MKNLFTLLLVALSLMATAQITITDKGNYIEFSGGANKKQITKPFNINIKGTTGLVFVTAFEKYEITFASISVPSLGTAILLRDSLLVFNNNKGATVVNSSGSSSPANQDYWITHAIANILADSGDVVSVETKNKDLLKFGLNESVQTTKTTLMTLPSGTFNEVYLASDLITTMSSSAIADSVIMTIEGHTVDGSGNFTFVVQTATLQGRTQVTLSTPLARISRAYNANGTDLTGIIYWYENNTSTLGVPDTDALVHLMIRAGKNNTEKASTTISSVEYWIVTGIAGSNLEKIASVANIHLEVRYKGGVFREVATVSASATGSAGNISFKPYLIIPKNADVRLVADADANNKEVSGSVQGVLVKIIP